MGIRAIRTIRAGWFTRWLRAGKRFPSSIVLGVGNGGALTGTSVAPDEDLVRFADPTDSIINAFDPSVLRGDGIFEATTVGGVPGLVGESSQTSAIRKAYEHA